MEVSQRSFSRRSSHRGFSVEAYVRDCGCLESYSATKYSSKVRDSLLIVTLVLPYAYIRGPWPLQQNRCILIRDKKKIIVSALLDLSGGLER